MGVDDIGGSCEMFASSDFDGPEVLIKGEAHKEGIKEVSHCLMGKVLAGKRINREAFKGVIEQLWSSFGVVEVEMIDDNLFVFYFPRKEDRGHVMTDCGDEDAKKEALDEKMSRYGVWMKAAGPSRTTPILQKGESMVKTRKGAVYGELKGIQSESRASKDRQITVADRMITSNPKEKLKGIKRWMRTGKEKAVEEGLENNDIGSADLVSQLSSEASGLGMGIKEGRSMSKVDIKNGIIGESNQMAVENLAKKELCLQLKTKEMDEVLEENDGCSGGNQCVEESEGADKGCEEHMVLSPGKVSVRKWRIVARKWYGSKGMLGVTSPIKRILEAHHIAKSNNRDKSLSPKGKGQQIRGSKKNSPKKRTESGVKRKIVLPAMEEGVEGELDNLRSKEEINWRQRSRSSWLAARDRNSRYFHHKASSRKRKNSIDMLVDDCGRKFTDEKGISDTVCNYFGDLFSSSSPSLEDFRLCYEVIDSRLNYVKHF
ncbi:hypothetical protein EZV62_012125 [Acer yangbiense]|uniref:DUF4283 domain-containing protein n=1 Tax=Acer yangbiense TaxID=1000413 RepID=A0A5C7HX76_9ROSI|nr:hypothetical protein EZV62_012125 [Acer yangbiense]